MSSVSFVVLIHIMLRHLTNMPQMLCFAVAPKMLATQFSILTSPSEITTLIRMHANISVCFYELMLCIDYSMRSMLKLILRFSTSKVHFLWKENSDGTSFYTDQLVSLLSEQRLVHASHPIKTHEYCSFPKTSS